MKTLQPPGKLRRNGPVPSHLFQAPFVWGSSSAVPICTNWTRMWAPPSLMKAESHLQVCGSQKGTYEIEMNFNLNLKIRHHLWNGTFLKGSREACVTIKDVLLVSKKEWWKCILKMFVFPAFGWQLLAAAAALLGVNTVGLSLWGVLTSASSQILEHSV